MKPTPNNHETKVAQDDFLVSKTDLKGRITYCNREFMKIAEFDESELLGKPHSIVRHPDMPKAVFKILWEHIQNKNEVFAYVKNMTASGGYYWVYANVTASLDANNQIVGYYSVRRKANERALEEIQKLYSVLLDKERNGGVDASVRYLNDILADKHISYNEFIVNLQHAQTRM